MDPHSLRRVFNERRDEHRSEGFAGMEDVLDPQGRPVNDSSGPHHPSVLSQHSRDANNNVLKNISTRRVSDMIREEPDLPVQAIYESPIFSVIGLSREFLEGLEVERSASATKAVKSTGSSSSGPTTLSSGEPGLYMRYTISRDATTEASRPTQSALINVLDRKREFRLR